MLKDLFFRKSSLTYMAMLLSFSTFAHADYYQSQSSGGSTYANSDKSQVSDQELTKKIRDKIGSGWFSKGYDQLVVRVNNGVVTLQGPVKTWDDKEKVEKEIRDMDGVKSLNSQITVQEPRKDDRREVSKDVGATPADDQLNKKIRDNVTRGWLWNSYKEVTLNTNNGAVTLEGTVDSASDQQKLINEIQKVEGVRSVRSNLRIKNR